MDYLSRQRAGLARRLKQLQRLNAEPGTDFAVSESAYSQSMVDTYEGEGFDSESDMLALSILVDTALLRVYVELNHALLGSLFRVRNYCDVALTEKLLQRKERWEDLVEFYRGKQLHNQALNLLKQSIIVDSIEKMVLYLQGLDMNRHQAVIVQYAKWVLEKDVRQGIKIFVDRFDQISAETQERIVQEIDTAHPDFSFLFLDHCIRQLKNEKPDVHEKFIRKYIEKALRGVDIKRLSASLNSMSQGSLIF